MGAAEQEMLRHETPAGASAKNVQLHMQLQAHPELMVLRWPQLLGLLAQTQCTALPKRQRNQPRRHRGAPEARGSQAAACHCKRGSSEMRVSACLLMRCKRSACVPYHPVLCCTGHNLVLDILKLL